MVNPMWINTRVVIDMTSGAVLEQEGFLYEGPLALAAGADRQALDAVLKDVFKEGVADGINNKNPLRDVIKTEGLSKEEFKGREVVVAAHTSGNISPMFVGEDSLFAEAGQQGYTRAFVDQKKLMARLRMTWEVMNDTTSSEGSFVSARKSEMQYLIDDIARRDEFALNSDGRGVLALVNEAPSGTVLDVDAPAGITNANFGNRFISKGMFIAAINPANGALRTTIHKVTDVANAGGNITVDSSTHTGWANNDYIVQAAGSGVTDVLDTSYEQAWWGLMALVDDGTYRANYFGVDRTVVPMYSSYVTASTGALSTDLIQRVSDVVSQKLNGAIDLIVCHHSTRRLFIQLTDADRRYSGANLLRPDPATVAFKQGDIPFGDVPVRALRDFPLDVVMLLDTKNSGLTEYVSEAGKWVDEDGAILQRAGTGSTARHAFEAWYFVRKQYFLQYPAYSARLDGVTGQSLVIQRPAGR